MTVAKGTVEAVRAEHATACRIIADLHAAYGKGVSLDIDAARDHSTWIHLYHEGNGLTVGFWDDGDVYSPETDIVTGGHLAVIEQVRVFIHRHGHGAR